MVSVMGVGLSEELEDAAGLLQEAFILREQGKAAGHHAACTTAGVEAKYWAHVQRQGREVEKVRASEALQLPGWVTEDWIAVPGIPRADAEAL